MKIFDTDIFIWAQRGNLKAAEIIDNTETRFLSLFSYMELLQGAKSREQHSKTKDFLSAFNFTTLPVTEKISSRAAVYIEEYSISSGLRAGDALIAATAIEHNLTLVSSNLKHFKVIKELKFELFKP